jgi:hypothetical protein
MEGRVRTWNLRAGGLGFVVIGAMLAAATPLHAQVTNPNVIAFLPPPDQATVSRYDVIVYEAGTTRNLLTIPLGKPAPQADGLIRVDIGASFKTWPYPGMTVDARVAAFNSAGTAVSTPSNTFVFVATTTTSGTTYLSDLPWTSMSNGWGPVERDRSNGEDKTGDGRAIVLNGITFRKGLGAHASSLVRYTLSSRCSRFEATVGVDDEVGSNGSVVFEVWADGVLLFKSAAMRGSTASVPVSVALGGRTRLTLVVGDGGDGNGSDHGDWGDARVVCDGSALP